jgi:hypothetical protein
MLLPPANDDFEQINCTWAFRLREKRREEKRREEKRREEKRSFSS